MNTHWALIAASGRSNRMGQDKLFMTIHGTSVLRATIDIFLNHPAFSGVVLTLPADQDKWKALKFSHSKLFCCKGGASRSASVYMGLKHLASVSSVNPWVWVHDAARPCLTSGALDLLVRQIEQSDKSTIVARRTTDTIKRADSNSSECPEIAEHCDRSYYWQAQTPQIARLQIITNAYSRCLQQKLEVSDEAGALASIGKPVRMIACSVPNPKITYPEDLLLATAIMQN